MATAAIGLDSTQAGPSTRPQSQEEEKDSKKDRPRRKSLSKPARKDGSREPTRQESLGGAFIRSLFGTLAFLFKRPVRLFRPVKLSSWTILEAMAKREGRSLSLRYIRSLLRRENRSFIPHLLLPPLLFNTAIGFTLFEAYSITESRLLAKHSSDKQQAVDRNDDEESRINLPANLSSEHRWTPLWIVTASGAVAGAAQCFLSAPLDNVRYIIQRNVDAEGHRGHKSTRAITTISWRAIIRAAILPFAPAIARDKLVKDVQNETIKSSKKVKPTTGIGSMLTSVVDTISAAVRSKSPVDKVQGSASGKAGADSLMSSEKRKEWERRLRMWRGGVHGSGLALSLIRDSVGFGSFFFIFEVSRRCAYFASTSVDRVSAWFNGRGLGIVRPPSDADPGSSGRDASNVVGRRTGDEAGSGDEVHIEGVGEWIRQGQKSVSDADVSYNQSRTVQGRVVAVIILLIGGAVGALSYELVGRPFELMRVVIWEGRKEWEQGKREPGASSRPSKSARSAKRRSGFPASGESSATGFTTLGRSAIKGARVVRASDGNKSVRKRLPDLVTLRSQNRCGTTATRIWAAASLSRPSHPLRRPKPMPGSEQSVQGKVSKPMLTSSRLLMERKKARSKDSPSNADGKVPDQAAESEETLHRTMGRKLRQAPSPTLATRPGFLTLLIEHAQSTHRLDRRYGSPDAAKASIPLLLLHTYFIAPFLPEIPKPILDNALVRAAAGVDHRLKPADASASTTSPSTPAPATATKPMPAVTTVAQRTLLMSLASRRRSADSPEAKVKRNWIRNNPVNVSLAGAAPSPSSSSLAGAKPGSRMTQGPTGGFGSSDRSTLQKGTRYWASGRVVWALKRLATPYGVAFLVFAWLGGDL
ncbi:hypothetical protein BCV70DRAFT_197877, partial [Testicularia cyperi]